MAAFGLCLKLTHLGMSQGSLHISDVPDGVDTLASFRKAGPIYVPYLGNVTVAYTGGVAISFEVGCIRGFLDRGLLTAEFFFGPTFLATLPGGPPIGPAGGDLDGTYPNPTVVDLTITGEVQGSVLYFDGSNWVQLPPGASGEVLTTQGAGADPVWAPGGGGGDVSGPGASTDDALVRWDGVTGTFVKNSNATLSNAGSLVLAGGQSLSVDTILQATGGNGVVLSGVRHYASAAVDPGAPAPADGDRYYNTTLDMEMRYDAGRAKWLSVESQPFFAGRNGNVPTGSYYRGADGLAMGATSGFDAHRNGTVVSISYTRADSDAATFEVMADGVAITSLASSAVSGRNLALNADFSSGQVLAVRNAAAGNTTTDAQVWVRVKWRV